MWLTLKKGTYRAVYMMCVGVRMVLSVYVLPLPHIHMIAPSMGWKLNGEILLVYLNAVSTIDITIVVVQDL